MTQISLLCLLIAVVSDCASGEPAAPATRESIRPANAGTTDAPSLPVRLDAKHLPNPVRVHAQVISGGRPDGEVGFRELAALGVQTVISVDGARPDVATARKYGIRYVHLPHGYEGISEQRGHELAKAVRELDGPVYIHCHHGRHRSPAAASVACVTAGLIEPSAALPLLKLAGTSPHYRGLYDSAAHARPLDKAVLTSLQVEFQETVELPPLADAMAALEQTCDHLNQIAESGWKTPEDYPDLDPAHEALLLQEHFTELLRLDDVRGQPAEFRRLLEDSAAAAGELRSALQPGFAEGRIEQTPGCDLPARRISINCQRCHQTFRDTPLSER